MKLFRWRGAVLVRVDRIESAVSHIQRRDLYLANDYIPRFRNFELIYSTELCDRDWKQHASLGYRLNVLLYVDFDVIT